MSTAALRTSARRDTEARLPTLALCLLAGADGSARVSGDPPTSGTVVTASVIGPVVLGGKWENPERATVDVTCTPRTGQATPLEKAWETLLQGLVERHVRLTALPRTTIQVAIHVRQDDGGALAAAINATCAALVDAGVPMSGLFAAGTAAVLSTALNADVDQPRRGRILLDPDVKEEQDALAVVTVAYPLSPLPAPGGDEGRAAGVPKSTEVGGVLGMDVVGAVGVEDLLMATETVRVGVQTVGGHLRGALVARAAAVVG